jgi:hypothetical protein
MLFEDQYPDALAGDFSSRGGTGRTRSDDDHIEFSHVIVASIQGNER